MWARSHSRKDAYNLHVRLSSQPVLMYHHGNHLTDFREI